MFGLFEMPCLDYSNDLALVRSIVKNFVVVSLTSRVKSCEIELLCNLESFHLYCFIIAKFFGCLRRATVSSQSLWTSCKRGELLGLLMQDLE